MAVFAAAANAAPPRAPSRKRARDLAKESGPVEDTARDRLDSEDLNWDPSILKHEEDVDNKDQVLNNNQGPCNDKVSPARKKRTAASSKIAFFPHLNELPETLAPNLICIFVGINPGVKTAETGHAYAHKSNWFWKLLFSGGCTDRLLPATYDRDMPRLYSLGLTNLVARPTANQTQLSLQEKRDGAPILAAKIRAHKPESVVFVGKDIWKIFHKEYFGVEMDEKSFEFGWQVLPVTKADVLIGNKAVKGDEESAEREDNGSEWKGAKVFVSFSTSGLVSFSPDFKRKVWAELGVFVNERRAARGEACPKEPFEIDETRL
ncbi:hypothetical protein HDU98_011030 [Podochytrium sp. JEL0797]|nr:hypothetical protein HDU98_011030 [Podochytrium sp. JEL0797]